MTVFGKSGAALPTDPSPTFQFWAWWRADGANLVAAAIDTGDFGELTDIISAKVAAIEPDLQWELGKGSSSKHQLCVTAAGVAENRPTAERWLRAAPAPDDIWEYRAARQADPNWANVHLEFAGRQVVLAETEVSLTVDEDSHLVDVTLFHPAFPEMAEDEREQLTYLLLDWILGEDDVERWLGSIELSETRPEDAVPATALPEVVTAMAGRVKPDHWVMLQGAMPSGAPVLVLVQRPLRWIDHPVLDQHNVITLPFSGRDDGLPTPDALEALRVREDEVVAMVEPQARLVAHETAEGRRLLHIYSDSQDQNITDRLATWAQQVPGASATATHDPSWTEIRKFR